MNFGTKKKTKRIQNKVEDFFDKNDKKMVDTLVTIQGGQKGDFFYWSIDKLW